MFSKLKILNQELITPQSAVAIPQAEMRKFEASLAEQQQEVARAKNYILQTLHRNDDALTPHEVQERTCQNCQVSDSAVGLAFWDLLEKGQIRLRENTIVA